MREICPDGLHRNGICTGSGPAIGADCADKFLTLQSRIFDKPAKKALSAIASLVNGDSADAMQWPQKCSNGCTCLNSSMRGRIGLRTYLRAIGCLKTAQSLAAVDSNGKSQPTSAEIRRKALRCNVHTQNAVRKRTLSKAGRCACSSWQFRRKKELFALRAGSLSSPCHQDISGFVPNAPGCSPSGAGPRPD